MYDYEINWSGIKRMLRSDAQLHAALFPPARRILNIAQSLVPVDTGELRNSGRVEDLGVKKPFRGNPRMTVAVVFHSRYAMDVEKRTGFLSGAIARGRKR